MYSDDLEVVATANAMVAASAPPSLGLAWRARRFFAGLCGRRLFGGIGHASMSVDADMDLSREGLAKGQYDAHIHAIEEMQNKLASYATAYDRLPDGDLRRKVIETQMITLDQQMADADVRMRYWETSWQTVRQWNASAGHAIAMRNALEFNEDFVRRAQSGTEAPQAEDLERTQANQMLLSQMRQQWTASRTMEKQIVNSGADAAASLMSSSASSAAAISGVIGVPQQRTARSIADILAAGRRLAAEQGAVAPPKHAAAVSATAVAVARLHA